MPSFKANCTDTKRASFVTSWSNWRTQIAHLTNKFKESFTWLYEALSSPSNENLTSSFGITSETPFPFSAQP